MSLSLTDTVASPFARLRALIKDIEPGQDPIDLSLGEPRHPMPAGIADIITASIADFGKYPPIPGTSALKQAISNWHIRRYPALERKIDPEKHIIPLNGSREGLFSANFTALDRRADIKNPAILIPNPFYQCYAAGALAGKAEPIMLDAKTEDGFLPDLNAIPTETLQRTTALFLCSPSNPQGAVANADYLAKAINLAIEHNFMIFSDECYSEIYTNAPPAGILEIAQKINGSFQNTVAFNSLSKRSNLPGLRSGFVSGDEEFITAYRQFRNVASPQIPLPIQEVSAHIWTEEHHVEENRRLYGEKLDAADEILKDRFEYARPEGGFFLWLNMSEFGGGESAVKTLWKEVGVKMVPGAYLAMTGPSGKNPGQDYVRVALVDNLTRTKEALERLVGI